MGEEEGRGGSTSSLFEEETERSNAEEEAPANHCDSEEEHDSVVGDEEGREGMRVRDRTREAAGHLTSRSYSFYANE